MRTLLSIIFCCFLAVSCAPSPQVPDYNQPKVAEKTASTLPDIDLTRGSVNSALNENKQLKRELDRSKNIVKEQGEDIDMALVSAEQMRDKIKSAVALKEIEMVNLIDGLNKVKLNNANLSQQNAILLFDLESQEKNLESAQNSAKKAQDKAINKEKEADSLRDALESEIIKNVELDKSNKAIKKFADKKTLESASAGVYKRWVISIVVGFVAYLILKNVAASVWPQASILRRL